MSETLDAPKTETPAAEDAARWNAHVGAFYQRLIDGGMNIDNATQAAYRRLTFMRWQQFIEQRVRELREDDTFAQALGYDVRLVIADHQAVDEAFGVWATEQAMTRTEAKYIFDRAGIRP